MARCKLYEVTVATRNPSGMPGDLGSCEVGFFTLDDDLVTLVEGDGIPIRKSNGERITARVRPSENYRQVASRLVLARWRESDAASDFNRPLRYGASGVA